MTRKLPHENDKIWYTDGGMETTFVFLDGIDLPEFAAFPLLDSDTGRQRLRDYYRDYLRIAEEHRAGFVLETPTWRASADWGARLGYDAIGLDRVNQQAVAFMREVARDATIEDVVISGNIGPRGDGYLVEDRMTVDEAHAYHRPQVHSFAQAGTDTITALTINYQEEAVGIARAAADYGMPAVISFTVETDGRLPSGESLGDAIERVDAEGAVSRHFFEGRGS